LNVRDIIKLIEWNEQNNIKCLRLSSDMFPHFTDTKTEPYTIDFAIPDLKKAGDLANKLGHRIVMHPGQYNQIGSNKKDVFENTVKDLSHHADILDAMGIDDNGVIIVHGGGTYKSKHETIERWIKQFRLLPYKVKRRLVLENCERQYSTEDCLHIASKCHISETHTLENNIQTNELDSKDYNGIPVVFDFHHYYCWDIIHNHKLHHPQPKIMDIIPTVIKSWKSKRVLMHISNQAEGKRIGAHSDYIESIPKELFDIIKIYNVSIDLEIEAKMKEQAILRLYNKYGTDMLKKPIQKIKLKRKSLKINI